VPQLDFVQVLDSLQTIRVGQVRDRPNLAGAEGLSFCVPNEVVRRTGLDRRRTGAGEIIISGDTIAPDSIDCDKLRMRAAYTPQPVSSRLPFSYRRIPGWMRSLLATAMGRWHRSRTQRWAMFPQWPLDLSVDFLTDWNDMSGTVPAGGPTPVVLSHRFSTAGEGLRKHVRDFLPIEEEVGARSTNFVVPCSWPLDAGLLRELADRGHEIGVHGYDHSNLTPFAPDSERRRPARRRERDHNRICGRRVPGALAVAVCRPAQRLGGAVSVRQQHPDVRRSVPTPNNGCATARPFRIGSILEIPLTLPSRRKFCAFPGPLAR